MKKILLALTALVVLNFTGCKTTEANYRAAYEAAKNKRTETGDSISTEALRQYDMPRPAVVNGDTLMMITKAVYVPKDGPEDAASMQRYCVVVAKFKQLFNARSMAERLLQTGRWPDAFVVGDRDSNYYVVAAATAVPSQALGLMEKAQKEESVVLKAQFPYVLRPAHLAR